MSAPTAPKKRTTTVRRSPAKLVPRDTHKPAGPLADAALVQSATEGGKLADNQVEFKGERYRIADSVGLWPMMQFARAAEAGVSVTDFRALAALHAFLQDCLHPDDWGRFQEKMISTKETDVEGLLDVATSVIEKLTARPTPPPSGSSNGASAPSAGSTGGSSSTPEAG